MIKISDGKISYKHNCGHRYKIYAKIYSNNVVSRKLRCDQAQTVRANNLHFFCKSNDNKPLFAPVDNHRSIGLVERTTQTLKRRLGIMRIDHTSPFQFASDVAELTKNIGNNSPRSHKNYAVRSPQGV